MTDHLTWDDFDPIAEAPSGPGSMADVPLDPRLAALRDGTAAPTEPSPARTARVNRLEAEHREYAHAIDEFDRLLDHVRKCPDISTAVMGVVETHITERRARVLERWSSLGRDLDILRRAS